MRRALLFAAAVALAIGAAGPAYAQSSAAPGEDPVIAIVNGEEIYRSHVSMLYSSLPQQYQQMPMEMLYPQLVEGLVDRKLLSQEARKAGLADDPSVQRRFSFHKDNVLQDAYLSRRIDSELTDDRLVAAYEEMVAQFPDQDEVHARHILLENKADAESVIAELGSGADFATLAAEYSTGPTASDGGDLGYFTQDQMVPAFASAAFALSPGEVTAEPVETQFGWHVIKVEDRRQAAPPSLQDSLPELRNQEAQKIIVGIMETLRAGAKIKRFTPEGEEEGDSSVE